MISGPFNRGSDEVYQQLIGRRVGQKWCGFDTLLPDARRGHANSFAMAVWNYVPGHVRGGTRPGVIEDLDLGQRWYFVPRIHTDSDGKNRKALWNGIALARELGVPMMAFLKDHVTKRASSEFVFRITDVAYEKDGSKLWLRLENDGGPAGTVVGHASLARLNALPRTDPKAAKPALATEDHQLRDDQVELAARIAERISIGAVSRAAAQGAMSNAGIAEATALRLFESYGLMRNGEAPRARLSFDTIKVFVETIVAAQGVGGLARAIESIRAHLSAHPAQNNEALTHLIATLEREEREAIALEAAAVAAKNQGVPSEVLREIWARGPQQRAFRKLLLRRWRESCSVHGTRCNELVRASHIIPWSKDEARRADVDNGLLLAIPLDSLFDKGLISFSDDGALLASAKLNEDTRKLFGVTDGLRLRWEHLLETDRNALRGSLREHRRLFGLSLT